MANTTISQFPITSFQREYIITMFEVSSNSKTIMKIFYNKFGRDITRKDVLIIVTHSLHNKIQRHNKLKG